MRDVLLNDSYNIGVKEKCIFCDVNYVDIPHDIGFDALHDGAEGVCHYTMIPVLSHFQEKNPSFLDTLNKKYTFLNMR